MDKFIEVHIKGCSCPACQVVLYRIDTNHLASSNLNLLIWYVVALVLIFAFIVISIKFSNILITKFKIKNKIANHSNDELFC